MSDTPIDTQSAIDTLKKLGAVDAFVNPRPTRRNPTLIYARGANNVYFVSTGGLDLGLLAAFGYAAGASCAIAIYLKGSELTGLDGKKIDRLE